jgi:hypothetical protein
MPEIDKARFIEIAPMYYALAICSLLKSDVNSVSKFVVFEEFSHVPEDSLNDEEENYLQQSVLFNEAEKWLVKKHLVDVVEDDFGPTFYRKTLNYTDKWIELLTAPNSIFAKYATAADGDDWLTSALERVNVAFEKLEITEADFADENKDAEWEPLPLHREEPELQTAIEAIDDTINLVRGDNGYAASVPEERKYILTVLSEASRRLHQEAEISVAWAKMSLFEPLQRLVNRFGPAAIGVAATVAMEAIKEWLKKKGINFLDWML